MWRWRRTGQKRRTNMGMDISGKRRQNSNGQGTGAGRPGLMSATLYHSGRPKIAILASNRKIA